MQMVEHIVQVSGPQVSNGHRSPEAIGMVLKWIEPTVRSSVSMAFQLASIPRGRRPEWLMAASEIRFADISNGQGITNLHFEAPRLGEAAEELYRQGEPGGVRPDPHDTGFDLVGDMLRDIASQARDSHRFDAQLLRRVEQFAHAGRWGVEWMTFHGDRLPEAAPPRIDGKISEIAFKLERETPQPLRARIAGRVDMIRASDGAFSMILDSAETINGVLVKGSTEVLKQHWNQFSVVEGIAVFRASGSLLRIEAEGIAKASEADRFFSEMPKPVPGEMDLRALRQPQTRSAGVGAVFGKWPGDETEDQLLAALKGRS